jgi:XTP/dITP diphosphohydrolase
VDQQGQVTDAGGTGRLTLLLTSPRVPPGLLTRDAWQALENADARLAVDLGDPTAAAVLAAGLSVDTVAPSPPIAVATGDTAQLRPSNTRAEQAWGVPFASLARELVSRATGAEVVWVGSADGDPGLSDAIADEVSRLATPPDVEVLVGSWDAPGARLLDVVAVMDRLRSPGGCPWDAEQTHSSLLPYLREETEELVEAVESGDRRQMAEELGDVLLQVAFHARVAEDDPTEPFDIDTVAGLLVDKLVRRHPHVFADGDASTPEEVEASWERIKEAERAAKPGASG